MSDPRLRRYVSRLQLSKIAARQPGSVEPRLESSTAAALWVDVSGFTSLTSALAAKGPIGVEEVSQVMSAYFGRITDIATGTGGDVIGYAGDGALILWSEHTSGGLPTATALAAQAGTVVQREFSEFTLVPGVSLGLRVSIGAGPVSIAEVGGVGGVWQFLVSGDAVGQAVRADRHSVVGDVLLSAEAWKQIGEWAEGEATESGHVRLASLSRPFSPRGERADPLLTSDDVLVPYVPEIALDRLAAEQERWLGEFRGVSVMFATLRELVLDGRDSLDLLHTVVGEVQEEVRRQEGRIYQFLTDDKGTTIIAAFGLPLNAHADDTARCVETALTIRDHLPDEVSIGVGIATGQAYCGVYGGWDRRQYAVVGPVMNRASRLAQQAGGIVCDESVARALAGHPSLSFETLQPLHLKGEAGAVAAYTPRRELGGAVRLRRIIGRRREREVLAEAMRRVVDEREGGVVIVQAEEGFGKSVLMEDFARRAREANVTCMVGEVDDAERDTPYVMWRSIVADLLELDRESRDSAELQRYVCARLPDGEGLEDLVPLLGDVLPLDLDPTSRTERLQGEVRAENTRRLLLALFRASARTSPLAFVLEDAHLGDSTSWDLLQEVARRVPDLLLVVTVRPVAQPPDGLKALAEMAEDRHLSLGPLSREEVGELLADRLGAPEIPPAVVELICAKAAGHPFFSEELGYALRDQGALGAEGGADQTAHRPTAEDMEEALERLALPTTVQGAITSRLDRLGAEELLTLRTASAIGLNFSLTLLREVYPVSTGRDDVEEHLARLADEDLVHLETDGGEPVWGFKHSITREVAYNAMPYEQRRELHQGIAEWHESKHGADAPHLWALLGYHWKRAGVPRKASRYLGRAGERALRQYANREAARLLKEALIAAEEAGLPDEQRAAWQLHLGRAYVNWSRYEEALPHLEAGISRHGHAAPRHPVAATSHLAGQLFLQGLHRVWPARFVGGKVEDRDRLLPLVPAYEGLVESHYLAGSTLPCLHAAVRALNLAESAGPSVELARGYASFGAIMGFVPLHGVAESYTRRAVETARTVADPAGTAWVYLATGVYQAGKGEWDRATGFFEDAARISEELGDRRRWEDCLQHLATVSYLTGDFPRALERADRLFSSAVGGGDVSGHGASEANLVRQLAALRIKAHCLLSSGSFDEAWDCVEGIRELLRGRTAGVEQGRLVLAALEALASVHQDRNGDPDGQVRAAASLLATSAVSSYEMLLEYGAIAEASLTLVEREEGDATRIKTARRTIKRLSSHGRVFPVARPATDLWRGLLHWHVGKQSKAFEAWEKSVETARESCLPLIEGLSHMHMGLHLRAEGNERTEHLTEAASILERIGALHHHARARSGLEGGASQ